MAIIRPFRAIRYDPARAGDLADLTTPPFDVISAAMQHALYERSPYNFVRLDFGRVEPSDDERDNRYTRAAKWLQEWLAAGILVREAKPALYVYRQTFAAEGETLRRTALLASLKLVEWEEGIVLPHEHTMRGPKADRLHLTRATQANLSPVFALSADGGRLGPAMATAFTQPPLYDFADEAGERHEVWVVTEPAAQAALIEALAPARLYIADGHHRYETALAYRAERRAAGAGPDAGSEYVLMAIVPADDPGLRILPTHRVIHNVSPEQLAALERLEEDFTLDEVAVADPAALAAWWRATQPAEADLGWIVPEPKVLRRLKLRDPARMAAVAPEQSEAWRRLAVSILHKLVLEKRLGIDADRLVAGDAVIYEQEPAEAARRVWDGDAQTAFLLQPTSVADVIGVSDAGEVMPQKSTYFYPKIRSGIVIHPLDA